MGSGEGPDGLSHPTATALAQELGEVSGQPADQAFSGSKPLSPSALKQGAESVLVPRQERTGNEAGATQAALKVPWWWGRGRGSSNTWMEQKVLEHAWNWLFQDMLSGCKTSSSHLLGTTYFLKN